MHLTCPPKVLQQRSRQNSDESGALALISLLARSSSARSLSLRKRTVFARGPRGSVSKLAGGGSAAFAAADAPSLNDMLHTFGGCGRACLGINKAVVLGASQSMSCAVRDGCRVGRSAV